MKTTWILTFACLSSLWANDQPQDEIHVLESIVVTAEKRPEIELEVPRSLTVLSGSTLETQNLKNIQGISAPLVNIQVEQFTASRLSFPYVRGIGAGQGNPAVTTNIDGVPQLSNNTSNLYLSQVERVEFLRGPQGTLYGRNALGGVINIHTRASQAHKGVDFTLGTGSDSMYSGDLALQFPLGDSTSLGLNLATMKRDGFTTNSQTGNSLDDKDMRHGRFQLHHRQENWEVHLGWIGQRDRDGSFPLDNINSLKANSHQVSYNFEGHNHRDVSLPSIKLMTYGDKLNFTSISSFGSWEIEDLNDTDFGTGTQAVRLLREEQDELYQELRLTSNESSYELFDWLFGLSFFKTDFSQTTDDSFNQTIPGFGVIPSQFLASADIKTEGYALFSQFDFHLGEAWALGLGVRYEREEKDAGKISYLPAAILNTQFTYPTLSEKHHDDAVLPRVSLTRRLNDQSMVYASATRGFRAGGFNPMSPSTSLASYDNEKSWSYELGYKALYEKFKLGVNLFQVKWEDMQLYLPNPPSAILPPVFYLDNVGKASSQGGELEFTFMPTRTLEMILGFGIIDASFEEDFLDTYAPTQNFNGNDLPQAPSQTWSAQLNHQADFSKLSLNSFAGITGVGSYAYDHTNNVRQASFHKVNLGLQLKYASWKLGARVDNLFNKNTIPLAFRHPTGIYLGESGTPRTFEFQLGANF
jgi:iron complex outermembrane recepter protein